MVESGNKVALGRGFKGKPFSYVEHKATGKRTVIRERNGALEINIRVPKGSSTDSNRAQEVAEKLESEGFQRPGTPEADLFYWTAGRPYPPKSRSRGMRDSRG